MTLEAYLALVATVFIFSLKPGPGIMTSVSYSMSHGVLGLTAFLTGFSIGLSIYLVIVFVGFIGVTNLNIDMIFIAILAKSLAAFFLISIGIKEFQKWNEDTTPNMVMGAEKAQNFLTMASSAIILTMSNPMVIIFYASLIPAFVEPSLITFNLAVLITFTLVFIDAFGMVIYCTPILFFRRTFPNNIMKYIKLMSAVIVTIIGLYIGYTALPSKDLTSVFG